MNWKQPKRVGLFREAVGSLVLLACSGNIVPSEGVGLGTPGGGASLTAGTAGASPNAGAMSGGASTSAGAANGGGSTAAGAVNGAGNSATACDKPAPAGNARVWRLTRTQIENTLRDNFGYVPPAIGSIPIEARLDGFANQAARLTISPLLAETFFTMGNELGAHAAQNPRAYGIACNVEQLAAGTCLSGFLNSAGSKMWRRPLTDAEVSSLTTLFTSTSAQGGAAAAVASVLQALLLSPNFLHRTELGSTVEAGAVTQLTHHEIASALSFLLWDSGPDEELLLLARDSKLRDRETLLKQARRMFQRREKSEPAMAAFFQQWLYLERLPSTTKSTEHFSMATPEVASDLDSEFRLFLSSVLFEPGGDKNLKTLFTSTYSFVNERTAPLYGITGVTGTTLVRRDLNPAQRRGVISMVPFLWGHSNAEETNLVGRGAHFRSQLLCERLVLPPGGVPPGNFAPPNSTGRQKLTIHSSPGCAGCHALFDGIGFALEQYDAIGRFRTTEYDQTIDPSGTLPLPSENNAGDGLVFANFIELVDKLVEKPDIYSCFAQQFASYASGRDYPELDPCERETLVKQFVASNYKIDELVMSVIGSPSFIDRKN